MASSINVSASAPLERWLDTMVLVYSLLRGHHTDSPTSPRGGVEIVASPPITVDNSLERNPVAGLRIRASGTPESALRPRSRGIIEDRRLADVEF